MWCGCADEVERGCGWWDGDCCSEKTDEADGDAKGDMTLNGLLAEAVPKASIRLSDSALPFEGPGAAAWELAAAVPAEAPVGSAPKEERC